MARGGARNRSGPQPDPQSERSEARGYTLSALPSEGYDGEVPEYPLAPITVYDIWYEDKQRIKEVDQEATALLREREIELWEWAWRTPQACAWSMEPWRWQAVAMWVRNYLACEGADAKAADRNSLHRFADQIGFTPAGLRENGWQIAPVAAQQNDKPEGLGDADDDEEDPRSRFQVIEGGA